MELDEHMDALLSFNFEFLLKLCNVIYYKMSTTTSQKINRKNVICEKNDKNMDL